MAVRKRSRPTRADRADKQELYERAVQNVEADIDFVVDTWKSLRPARRLTRLREDFSGAGAVTCEFVRRSKHHHGWAVDLDPAVLEWGRDHRVSRLKPSARERVHQVQGNVLEVRTPPVDVVLAMNFSYWVFKTREQMRDYFRRARESLARDGLFMVDAFGGHDAFRVRRERRKLRGFTYVWQHARYDPVTGELEARIDFTFPDGSALRRAFTYDWRLWTLPELRELLLEAGFRKATVYWQGWDEKGEADGEFKPVEHGEPDAGWIAYLIAEK